MPVDVIVPWRPGCPHRERAWQWIEAKYREQHPDFQIVVAASSFPGPWVKAAATTPSIAASKAEIIVLADADVWNGRLPEAVEAVREGAPWAVPHRSLHRLTEEATQQFMAGAEVEALETTERVQMGVAGGGIVVARRDTFLDIPLDIRFTGWGQEDHAWALAAHHLAGPCWRPTDFSPLAHLWHPPQKRLTRRYGSIASKRLYEHYAQAARKGTLRSILEEAKFAYDAHQSALQPDPADGLRGSQPLRGLDPSGDGRGDGLRASAEAA